jgi:serine/threonine protein kinase
VAGVRTGQNLKTGVADAGWISETAPSMPAPTTIAEFIDIVRKSGVTDDDLINAYLEKQKSIGDMPTEPTRFAGQMVREGLITFFQAEQFLQGKWKRFHIGKYKVLERLGAGGMGQVFLCEHKLMRRRVAVKVLPTARAEDPSALERFYREARAVAALDHLNLVRAFDIDQSDGLHFLVLEYVDGANLQDIVKKSGPLDPERACHYIRQAAVGLDYAYQVAGLVHRDIKPGNILVDRTGVVKILDMGLARFFNDETDILTRKYDEQVIGTADYLSPEQANDSHSADIRSDLYSLGATFYFLLTGQPPFPDGSVAQKLIAHQTRQPKSVRELRPGVSPVIAAIVEKLMMKAREARYQTPAELDEALAPFTSRPIPPPPESEMPQLSLAAASGPGSMVAPVRRVSAASHSSVVAKAVGSAVGAQYRAAPSAVATRPAERNFPPMPGSSSHINNGATPTPSGDTRELNPLNPFHNLLPSGSDTMAVGRHALESIYAPGAVAQPRPSEPGDARPEKSQQWLYLTAGVLAALAAGMAFRMWLMRDTVQDGPQQQSPIVAKPAPAAAPPAVREWNVDLADGPNSSRTIAAAIRKARPGDRILIKVPTVRETVVFDGKTMGCGDITIESGLPGGEPILWVPPAGSSASTTLVDIMGYSGITFRNVIFDGQNRLDTVIRCADSSPGVVFDRVHFRGASKAALRLASAAGQADQPIVVQNSRFQSGSRSEAAILLASAGPSQPVQFVRITNCTADGPFQRIIEGDGSAAELTIERNRFFQADHGVFWKGFQSDDFIKARIVNNTFVEMKGAALHFESLPPMSDASSLIFRHNLIVKSGAILEFGPGMNTSFLVAGSTVRDESTRDGDLTPAARVEREVRFLSSNPLAKEFLRYSKGSKLANSGSDGSSVGAPPLD